MPLGNNCENPAEDRASTLIYVEAKITPSNCCVDYFLWFLR